MENSFMKYRSILKRFCQLNSDSIFFVLVQISKDEMRFRNSN